MLLITNLSCILRFDPDSFLSMRFRLLQYELVGELFSEKVAGPAPTKRQRGVLVRAAKEQPKGGAALKSHKQTVGSQVWGYI